MLKIFKYDTPNLEYRSTIVDKAKKRLDNEGITEENVKEISLKADKDYFLGKFDEVEAEYQTLNALKGR